MEIKTKMCHFFLKVDFVIFEFCLDDGAGIAGGLKFRFLVDFEFLGRQIL